MTSVPERCPECGSEAPSKRFATGGGWRVVAVVCDSCSHRERLRA